MIVFCCILPASNKARDDYDDGIIRVLGFLRHSVAYVTRLYTLHCQCRLTRFKVISRLLRLAMPL